MEDPLARKLAAILYADVAGYSRLTAHNEDETHRTLTRSLDFIAEQVQAHRGRVGHYAGDAVLADFASATNALSCPLWVQRFLCKRHASVPEEGQLHFRIGINLGEVIDERGEVYGDGVNMAARLEAMAVPGGLCVADAVKTAVGNRLSLRFEDLGECQVKNIPTPVRAWRIDASDAESPAGTTAVLRAEVRAYGVLVGANERSTRDALDQVHRLFVSEIEKPGRQCPSYARRSRVVAFQRRIELCLVRASDPRCHRGHERECA